MSIIRDFWVNVVGVDKPKVLNLNGLMPDDAPRIAAAPASPAPLAAGPSAPGQAIERGGVCKLSADDTSEPQENQLQLLFEQKTLQDKLKAPRSYRGREADEARLEEINRKLGLSANQCTVPPPKDPRVAELARESRKELSDELDPNTALLLDRKLNGPMIEEYYEIRREIQDYLDNIDAQNSTSKDLGDAVLKAWAKAIYDVGELRRVLASNVVGQHTNSIQDEQKRLQDLNKYLKELKDKNKRVEEGLKQIEDGVKWTGYLLKLNDALELTAGYVESIGKLGTKLAKAQLAAVGAKIYTESSIIEQGIEKIAHYYSQLTVAVEGFASVEKLEEAIKGQVELIQKSVREIDRLIGLRDRAQRVYDTAVSEAPKK